MQDAYSKAGVDVQAGQEVVSRIRPHVARSKRPGVMGEVGGFGGYFDLAATEIEDPILVSGTDGVGTKLLVAIAAGQFDTVGIDCVAMCVNDVLVSGATPLYFLDYVATGKLDPKVLEEVVAGVAEGCVQAGAALIGGETAEMPGMYQAGDLDMAGFAVGAVSRSQLITGNDIEAGDVLVGLPSSGFHSNGYSLIRKVFFEDAELEASSQFPTVSDTDSTSPSVADVLLTPTRIYAKALLPLFRARLVRGAAHITGGGFVENLPRMVPEGLGVEVNLGSWPVPEEFEVLRRLGEIPPEEMYQVFNMGIGMVLAIEPKNLSEVQKILESLGEESYVIGSVTDDVGIRFTGKFH